MYMTRSERTERAAKMIAHEMRKVNSYLKYNPFCNEHHDHMKRLEGMLDMLTVMGIKWEIIWEDPEEMAGYDGIDVEGKTWLVL